MHDHVIVCGLGHVGFRCFELLRQAGVRVTFVAREAPEDWRAKIEEAGGRVLLGDARSDALLREAGVERARAILAATDDDLANVSIMIDARRLNPRVRVIGRMFDLRLGEQVARAFDVSQVFSTSDLAAPKFVDAVAPAGLVREGPRDGGRLILGDGPEHGDPIAAFAEGRVTDPRSAPPDGPALRARRIRLRGEARARGRSLRALRNAAAAPGLSKLRWTAAAIAGIVAVGAIAVRQGLGLSWIDSVYFVVTTVTTVGYGDFNFASAPAHMKAFGVALMLVGATSLAVLFSAVAEAFLSQRLANLFGGKPIPRGDHVIVVGAGNVGSRIVELLLALGLPTVAIENEKAGYLSEDLRSRVATVDGDPRSGATLARAGAKTARALIAATNDDVENLSVALAAREMNPNVETVARLFDADLGAKLQGKANLNRILSVPGNAANHFVAAVFADGVHAAVRWKGHLVFLAERSADRLAPVSAFEDSKGQALRVFALPLSDA